MIEESSPADDKTIPRSDDRTGPAAETLDAASEAHEKVRANPSWDNLLKSLSKAIENSSAPSQPVSRLRSFVKDYLPALTPIATGIIAAMVSYYIYQSDHNRSKEALDKTLTEFGEKTDERARAIAAIKLAAYGDEALPALKMVLGSEDDRLRSGGVLVAEQMYRASTVERTELTKQLLSYYAANDATLRRGVLEWLVKMGRQLSDVESRQAFGVLVQTFGSQGQNCATQDDHVAMEATNFLLVWSFKDSVELLSGMIQKCPDQDVRRQAKQVLDAIKSE